MNSDRHLSRPYLSISLALSRLDKMFMVIQHTGARATRQQSRAPLSSAWEWPLTSPEASDTICIGRRLADYSLLKKRVFTTTLERVPSFITTDGGTSCRHSRWCRHCFDCCCSGVWCFCLVLPSLFWLLLFGCLKLLFGVAVIVLIVVILVFDASVRWCCLCIDCWFFWS